MKKNPILKIHKFVFLAEKALDRRLQSDVGLSFSQSMILVHVAHNPEISQRHVACERDITPAAVSRHIEALEEAGLIMRKDRHNNKREHVLTVTVHGGDVVVRAEQILDLEIKALLDELAFGDSALIERIFDRLLAHFED